ncbi:MAG: aspartyl protease family protein [Gemmatimonadota bacterium]
MRTFHGCGRLPTRTFYIGGNPSILTFYMGIVRASVKAAAPLLTVLTALVAGCAGPPGAGPPVVVERVGPGDSTARVSTPPPASLELAVRTLDTLYAPPSDASTEAAAVMAAVRDIRNGRMDAALGQVAAVANQAGPDADIAREILGQLLFHHGEWSALAGSPGGAAPLFGEFARAEPEEWDFPAGPVVLPLEATAVATPTVEARVNGVARRFWIDAGAGLTVLSSELAEEAGIAVDVVGGRARTATGRDVATSPAIIDELRIGPVRVHNHPAMVMDTADLHFGVADLRDGHPGVDDDIAIDGILGWPVIRRLDLTLDFAGGEVVIREPAPRPEDVRNLFWLGYPVVAARAENGRALLLGLDTGASKSFLAPGFLEKAGERPDGTRSRRIGGAGGFETVTVEILDTAALRIGDWRVRFRDEVDIRDDNARSVLDLDGVLGADVAARRALRIDFVNGRFDLLAPGSDGAGP